MDANVSYRTALCDGFWFTVGWLLAHAAWELALAVGRRALDAAKELRRGTTCAYCWVEPGVPHAPWCGERQTY